MPPKKRRMRRKKKEKKSNFVTCCMRERERNYWYIEEPFSRSRKKAENDAVKFGESSGQFDDGPVEHTSSSSSVSKTLLSLSVLIKLQHTMRRVRKR